MNSGFGVRQTLSGLNLGKKMTESFKILGLKPLTHLIPLSTSLSCFSKAIQTFGSCWNATFNFLNTSRKMWFKLSENDKPAKMQLFFVLNSMSSNEIVSSFVVFELFVAKACPLKAKAPKIRTRGTRFKAAILNLPLTMHGGGGGRTFVATSGRVWDGGAYDHRSLL